MGGILLYAAIFLIVFDITYPKLLFYAATIAIAYPILLVPYMSLTYDVIGKGWKAAEMRIEYIVVRELFLNAGRIVSILMFLFSITFFNEEKSFPVLLMVLGAGHTCIYFLSGTSIYLALMDSKTSAGEVFIYLQLEREYPFLPFFSVQ